ncbi:MAG: hypothetical protein V1708_02670 [Candidatus Micrarchaeota archaeon]
MKDEGKSAVVLLVLAMAANAAWIAFSPSPFGNSDFLGRIVGISVALLVVPAVLAYWCARRDARGFSGSALYGVAVAAFMLANDQLLLETNSHNAYSRLLLATAALIGVLLAYVGYTARKGTGESRA